MHTIGLYRRGLRHLAKRLKDGKPSAIIRTAEIFAKILPTDSVIIPMPSHNGRATVMLEVADAVSSIRRDCRTADILSADPHCGQYAAKKTGAATPHIVMHLDGEAPRNAVIIDNVIDTGATYRAAQAVLPNAELYAIAHTH